MFYALGVGIGGSIGQILSETKMRRRRDEGKADWELNGLDRILSLSYLISRIGPIAIIRPMNLKAES